jgi:hypothetical protein
MSNSRNANDANVSAVAVRSRRASSSGAASAAVVARIRMIACPGGAAAWKATPARMIADTASITPPRLSSVFCTDRVEVSAPGSFSGIGSGSAGCRRSDVD